MPTGYTAAIKDGITFKEYAMGCARAFGALITMRDDPQNADIHEKFEPSNYHLEHIDKITKELEALSQMDADAATAKAQEEYVQEVEYHTKRITEDEALANKYKAMLAEVEAYQAPSSDHVEFKKFMASQITESIQFDCGSNYHKEALATLKALSGGEWLAIKKEQFTLSLKYHHEAHQGEVERTNKRNEWVQKLRDSLNNI